MDRLRGLECFRKIAERGSFAAAARDLNMSPGAITKQINALEDMLGVQLISRTTRRLSLTEAGETYLGRVSLILDDMDDANETVRDLGQGPRGCVRIAAPTSFGVLKLAPVIGKLLNAHPDLSIDLVLDDKFTDIIDEGFDIALRVSETLADSSLMSRRICSYSRVLVASPDYLASHPPITCPHDLLDHDCILFSSAQRTGLWHFTSPDDGAEMAIEVSGRYRVNSSLAMRDVLTAGSGITLTPRLVVEDLVARGELVCLLTEYLPRSLNLYALSAPHRHKLRKIRTVTDFLAKELRLENRDHAPTE
ncbi:LysR family transcriptional regulator [Thalassospira marina]|uniref:LysR family transcriptional regulator n=1 Tax=Thalassospira marina TaxID=2048283 RepID=A0A2N3KWG8_9PROT|nr:LysR family transcriptional regulator [Thalassospira marina]PKR54904.1 LysR family transcriptional regulator [Thalassospira marina]